jgi:hypothetical protein
MATQWVPLEFRYAAILGLFLTTYLISAWSLFEDLKGVEWFTILILPSMYSAAMALFNFLLPEHWISMFIVLILYGIGLYAILLTENIFSVAAIRTIQLVRAAYAVGFLITILTIVLFTNTIFSLHLPFYVNGLLVFVVSMPLFVQGLWSIQLLKRVDHKVLVMSLGCSLLMAETAVVLSFLPVTVWIASLFLGTLAYVSLGLLQHALHERLFTRTIWEYVAVGLFVLIASLLVIPWR